MALKSISSKKPKSTWNVPSIIPIFLVILAEVFLVGAFVVLISVVNKRNKKAEQPEVAVPKTGEVRAAFTPVSKMSGGGPVSNVDDGEMVADGNVNDVLDNSGIGYENTVESGSDGNIDIYSEAYTIEEEDNVDIVSDENDDIILQSPTSSFDNDPLF